MKKLATALAALVFMGVASAEHVSLGYREDTIITGTQSDECGGTLVHNHDYSFETGYGWDFGGCVPPYYGGFGEGYDVGAANVECGIYWFSQVGFFVGQPMDVYLWGSGVSGPPSGVLCVVPGVSGLHVDYWPTCTMNEVEIGCCVAGEFTVGYWADFTQQPLGWYICADANGPGGFSWTCIAPGIGFPTGWQPVTLVWPDCVSLGLAVTITDVPSPVESQTWGSIKALFE